MTIYIGLDLHSKRTVYVAQDADGRTIASGSVETSSRGLIGLLEDLGAAEGTEVAMESGTQATWAARLLEAAGMSPVVIDAAEVRAKARRRAQKSDLRDAWELCDGLRRDIYVKRVYVPPLRVERLRRVLSRRRHFVEICTSQVNAASFLFRSAGLRRPVRYLRTENHWCCLCDAEGAEAFRHHLLLHFQVWLAARRAILELEEELAEAISCFGEESSLLQSLPGVGPMTSAAFIAALGCPERFGRSAEAASYIGLVPSGYDTGGVIRRGRITKSGPPYLRALLCEAAHHAARSSHPLNPYWRRICSRGGYGKAVVAVAHRMARILWAMWRGGRDFDVSMLNVERVSAPESSRRHIYRLRRSA